MLVRAIAERDGNGPITVEPTKLSAADYFAEWLASKRPELAADTYRGYAGIFEYRLVPLLVSRLRSKEMEPSTIRHIMAVLSAALNQAVAWELLPSNPASNVRRPKDRSQKMRALSEKEAARLMAVVRGTRREVLYGVALTLGPRQGELRGLRWSSLSDGYLTIEHRVSTDYGVVWGPTKTGEERTLRLPRRLVDALRRHRKAQPEERAAASVWEDPSLIFPNTREGIWRHQGMFVCFKRDLAAAGPPKEVRFHDLRHTAATLMLKKRVPVNVVSKVLGHSDPAMTLRRYAHALPDMQEMAADAMEEYAF
ncbi:MAG TPA: site-specific integrase [Rubrobacter sp.]|nr:site-specific integrase [Rubrobacter sp.]